MTKWLRSTRQRLWKAWMSLQVEFQGRYSIERLQQLNRYSTSHGSVRLILVCLLTPLPGLAFSLVKELPPLAPPSAGFYENWVFIVRAWAMLTFFNGSALMQMGHGAPRLKLPVRRILFMSIFAATVATGIMIIICTFTVFPLPFGLLVIGIPDVGVIAVLFTMISRPKWRADPSLLVALKQQLVVYNCQVVLPFVYPLYILGFVSLDGIYQTLFVMVLPVIQLSARNSLADNNDMKPESVIFIVEVFNALYTSSALHNSSSWSTTAMVMMIDLVQFWISMVDIMKVLDEMKTLVNKIPDKHPMKRENFVQIVIRLVDIEAARDKSLQSALQLTKAQHVCYTHDPTKDAALGCYTVKEKVDRRGTWMKSWIRSNTARVLPFRPADKQNLSIAKSPPESIVPTKIDAAKKVDTSPGLETIFSRKERIRFIHKATRVLFMTEYLVMIEYVEVAMPIAYSLHRLILSFMHNSIYYPSLAGLSRAQLWASVSSVLCYSLLEFMSLLLVIFVLKQKLGLGCLQQLAFVLETQAEIIQFKLNVVFVYIMQVALEHHGESQPFTSNFVFIGPALIHHVVYQGPISPSSSNGFTRPTFEQRYLAHCLEWRIIVHQNFIFCLHNRPKMFTGNGDQQ